MDQWRGGTWFFFGFSWCLENVLVGSLGSFFPLVPLVPWLLLVPFGFPNGGITASNKSTPSQLGGQG